MNTQRTKTSPWVWFFAAVALIVLGGMTFMAGFGAGFATGRATAPQAVAINPPSNSTPSLRPTATPRATVTPDDADIPAQADDSAVLDNANTAKVPQDFNLIWEAWGALDESFYGEMPDVPQTTGGLVEGMLRAVEMQSGQPLDREQIANAVLAATLQIVQEQVDDVPDVRTLTYGAVNGMTFRLEDDYTYLRTPEEAQSFNESLNGSFEGIGARVGEAEGGGIRIVEPFEGQPAWSAGIRRNDVILAVDGQDVTRMPLQEAINLIRGPKGSKIVLTIKSEGQEPRDIEVVRDRIEVPAVEYRMLDNNIAYLRLGEFSAPSSEQVQSALDSLLAENPKGLVLDLRGNPGGFLRSAVDITSEFISEGPVVIERFKNGDEQVFETKPGGRALQIPLVVLVNEGSASASEILAGALQDNERGVLIGVTTFGKGSVQIPSELSDGSVLSITTARWFTPKDRQINGLGLEPDIVVERSDADIEADRDPQLDRAVEYLLQGK
ncbi:MAG: S41 family peptidase [Caldilineales bacterium]